jgi:hypothetical protein
MATGGSKPLWRIKTILCLKNARLNCWQALIDWQVAVFHQLASPQ